MNQSIAINMNKLFDVKVNGVNINKEDLIKIAKHVNASLRAEYAMREWGAEAPQALAMGYDFERYAERELEQTEIPEWVWDKVCGEHGNPGLN